MDKTIKIFLHFLMIIITLWLFNHIQSGRYEMITAGEHSIYKLDKWSGSTFFIAGSVEFEVSPHKSNYFEKRNNKKSGLKVIPLDSLFKEK
jgi:hypothetical protein